MEDNQILRIPPGRYRDYNHENLTKLQDVLIIDVNGVLQTKKVKEWINICPQAFLNFINKEAIILTPAGQRRLTKNISICS